MATANHIVSNLCTNSGLLIFVDDTDIVDSENARLEPNIRILCACILRQGSYQSIEAIVKQRLGSKELHMTDMASGKKEWRGIQVNERVSRLHEICDLVTPMIADIPYCHISKGQYDELKSQRQELEDITLGWKGALHKVFLISLLEELVMSSDLATIIKDQQSPLSEAAFDSSYENSQLLGGAPISADSSKVIGLQIADLCAWTISRYIRFRDRLNDDNLNPFDKLAVEFVAANSDKIRSVLSSS